MRYPQGLCLAFVALLSSAVIPPALAQEPQMSPEQQAMMAAWEKAMTPGEPHAELAKLAGEWRFTGKSWEDPTKEPSVFEGTASRTMILGGRVLEERVASELMGRSFEGIGFTGYDNVTAKYWSTWFDNMSTGLMTTEGSHDEATGVGTFEGTVADPMSGTVKRIRMTTKTDAEGRELNEFFEDRGGEWVKTMELLYQRK